MGNVVHNAVQVCCDLVIEGLTKMIVKNMSLQQKLQERRNDIIELARARGAYNIRIFGSVARGEATESSDIDLLVDLAPGRTLFDLGGLLHDLQDVLDCKVDVVTEKGLRQRIRQEILAEAIPL